MVLVSTRKAGALMTKGVYRNMFTKKNAAMEAQVMQDITDEQLGQITGGGLLSSVSSGNINLFDVLGTVTGTVGTVAQLGDSVSISGIKVQAAGVSISTPAITTKGLL